MGEDSARTQGPDTARAQGPGTATRGEDVGAGLVVVVVIVVMFAYTWLRSRVMRTAARKRKVGRSAPGVVVWHLQLINAAGSAGLYPRACGIGSGCSNCSNVCIHLCFALRWDLHWNLR